MFRRGDYHYDQNKLKAIDLYCKIVGGFAPTKHEITGKVEHVDRKEVKMTLHKLIRIMDDSKKERREAKAIEVEASVA